MIDANGIPVQLEKGWPFERGTTEPFRLADYCSAAALGMKKEVFQSAGGFDLTWEPAYYEDVDLCLKIRGLGLKVVCATESHVVHLEHATTARRSRALDLRGQPEFNRRKFVSRWGDVLRAEAGAGAPHMPLPARPLARNAERLKTSVRRIALYTPYQLVPGGGERYLLMLAAAAGEDAHVTFLFHEAYSALRIQQLARELDVRLPASFAVGTYSDLSRVHDFDVFIAMGNEVFPPVAGVGRRNIYVCQFPFPARREEMISRAVLDKGYDTVLVYSRFAAEAYADARRQAGAAERTAVVLYPPCGGLGKTRNSVSENRAFQIISVGRFFQGGHEKRHDVMINAFRSLRNHGQGSRESELHLVGTAMQQWGSRAYLAWLERSARDLPVYFHVNASAEEVRSLLTTSAVYWHAAGFGVDERHQPEKLEHFGISVVEAMARGCLPIAYDAGGPKEIISPGVDGLLYRTEAELVADTLRVLQWWEGGSDELKHMASAASTRAAEFTDQIFVEQAVAVLVK
jgi:glycosyltransferase involved in cell wall biosynthesis